MISVFLTLLLSHFLCDFITQTDSIIRKKREYQDKLFNAGILIHVIHHFIFGILLLLLFNNLTFTLIVALLMILFIHYFIDLLKINYEEKIIEYTKNNDSWIKNIFYFLFEKKSVLFLIDQVLHIVTIFVILTIFNQVMSINELASLLVSFFHNTITLSLTTKITTIAILLIILTWGSSYFIAEFFKDIKKQLHYQDEPAATIEDHHQSKNFSMIESQINTLNQNIMVERAWEFTESDTEKRSLKIQYQHLNEKDNNSAGKYIGIFERILIAIFVILGAYQGLVLLGAFKTLTRFKQFEDKSFAEYYLIGTLLSILIAVTIGEIIKKTLLAPSL